MIMWVDKMSEKIVVVSLILIMLIVLSSCNNTSTSQTVDMSDVTSDISKIQIEQQDLSGNRISGGYVNICGDNIYFANRKDQNKLYKMNLDGSDISKLSDLANDSHKLQMQHHDNKLFYIQTNKAEGAMNPLYMFDLNSGQEAKLVDENIYTFLISENNIYFTTLSTHDNGHLESDLFRMDFDANNIELIKEYDSPALIQISEDKLYVDLDEGLEIISFNGEVSASKYLGLHFPVLVYDGYTYIKSDGLSRERLDVDDSSPIAIIQRDVYSFTVYRNKIYYSTTDDKIYETNLDGKDEKFIGDGNLPIVCDGYIFYYSSDNKLTFTKK